MIVKRETPRCLIAAEEEVTNVQLFTSRQIPGNAPKDRVIFATFYCVRSFWERVLQSWGLLYDFESELSHEKVHFICWRL